MLEVRKTLGALLVGGLVASVCVSLFFFLIHLSYPTYPSTQLFWDRCRSDLLVLQDLSGRLAKVEISGMWAYLIIRLILLILCSRSLLSGRYPHTSLHIGTDGWCKKYPRHISHNFCWHVVVGLSDQIFWSRLPSGLRSMVRQCSIRFT